MIKLLHNQVCKISTIMIGLVMTCMPGWISHDRPEMGSNQYLWSGIEEALNFRNSLFEFDSSGLSLVEKLSGAIAKILRDELGGIVEADTADILRNLNGFTDQNEPVLDLMESFCGHWSGDWKGTLVLHHWEKVIRYETPVISPTFTGMFALSAIQYVWVGDGFGWNIEMIDPGQNERRLLLGSVFHLNDKGQIDYHVPHVGIAGGKGMIAWVVPGYVFFEKVTRDRNEYIIAEYQWQVAGHYIKMERTHCAHYSRPSS